MFSTGQNTRLLRRRPAGVKNGQPNRPGGRHRRRGDQRGHRVTLEAPPGQVTKVKRGWLQAYRMVGGVQDDPAATAGNMAP